MELGDSQWWASSHLQQNLCIILACIRRFKCVGAFLWRYVLLTVLLTSCSSLFASSSSQPLESSSSVVSFPGTSRSSIRAFGGEHSGGDQERPVIGRRQLIVQEGDYVTVRLIEKDHSDVAALPRDVIVKEANDHELLQKVANGDEDYENVALTAKVTKEGVGLRDGTEKGENDGVDLAAGEHKEDDGATAKGAKTEHTRVEKFLDLLEESTGNEKDGRFNKTISEQEGVLETVARVGGRAFDDDEEPTEEEKKVSGHIDAEIFAIRSTEEAGANEEVGLVESSEDSGEMDVTWLDRIMGQSDQPHQSEPPHPFAKEGSKIPGKNNSALPQKNASTRDKLMEDNAGYHQVDDVPRLLDREDNEYVISNPGKNRMMLQEDLTLISDIVMVIVAAALGGTICGLLGQPVILGYLAAGMLVGPGGLHLVHELVQVETLAQFGVVFLLFVLGVEFNPSKMQGIHNVALGGGCLQIGTAMLLGGLLGSSIPQGIFVGAFLSMSSTAVVVKCLIDSEMNGTEHGQIMLGTLILQDCALGLLLAVMPALAAKGSDTGTFALALSRAAVLLLVFCGSAWVLAKLFIPRFLRALVQLTRFNSELFLLGAIGVCLSLALISQTMGLSLEVGAFVAGLVLSGGTHTEKTLHQVEPIRNVFAALFLASIGMVMHPVFLWEHIDILMASLGVVFIGKTCLFSAVVRTFGYTSKTSVSVGIALAQIGEFAFILLSRAQGLGLVSKKLYLLLMGTSALSLVLTPFAFKIVIRMNPPLQPFFRKASYKLAHDHGIQAQEVVNQGFAGTLDSQKDGGPSYWSLTNLDTPGNFEGSETVPSILSSNLNEQVEYAELIDMEGARGERPASPVRVIFRRPYHPVTSGKWNEWRKELEASEVYHQR